MKPFMYFIFLAAAMALLYACRNELPAGGEIAATGKGWYTRQIHEFTASLTALRNAFEKISPQDSSTVNEAVQAFKKCRLQYKRIAFFMEYFFAEGAMICNGPPVPEAEPGEEFRDPSGLQVIESLLYAPRAYLHKEELINQAGVLTRMLGNFAPFLADIQVSDQELLESLHQELTRIITLYITGYDAPVAKTGIEEAYVSWATIDTLLAPYAAGYPQKHSLYYFLEGGKTYLRQHDRFDSFDRLLFITRYAMPVEKQLSLLMKQAGFEEDGQSAFSIYAYNLFAPAALRLKMFPHTEDEQDTAVIRLGKQLFSETALSQDRQRSCATCHSPAARFTDLLPRNKTLDGQSDLHRNTPTLLYAGYQHAQFWDGRAGSLEEQIRDVLRNRQEMNISEDTVIKRLSAYPHYVKAFRSIWKENDSLDFAHAVGAIAAFVRTLAPFSSPFDRYMQGDRQALSAAEKRGFNLFMGKAACGTCHFAPLFNGLLPPDYTFTEFEVLGTTADDHFERPRPDSDQGRYNLIPLPFNKGAFKTPTVRNAAVTAPYMHNGAFTSLEKVITFYDKGGGAGLGLDIPQQTLSGTPLQLSKQEQSDIISFIKALTDQ